MKPRHLPLLAIVLAFAFAFAAHAQTPATPAPVQKPETPPPSLATGKAHHIVIANPSSDAKDWEMAVGNARTLITYLKPDTVEVEIVSYSGGIDMLKLGSPVANDIAELQKMGVRFAACQRAMRGHNLELKDLVAGIVPVPAGIVEVVLKQEQGWTYLKAGH